MVSRGLMANSDILSDGAKIEAMRAATAQIDTAVPLTLVEYASHVYVYDTMLIDIPTHIHIERHIISTQRI